jgi:hypothetical protein
MAESAVEFYRINGSFSFPIILSRENPNDGKPDISVKTNPPNPTNDFRARQGNKTPSEKQESRFTGAIYKDAQNDDKPDQLTLLPLKPDRNALPGKTKRINKKEFRKGKAS